MDLISEYKQQQTWRNWQDYLAHIPLKKSVSVIDLGCSVGNVSNLFSTRVERVIGVDINSDFFEFCQQNRASNQTFMRSDFSQLNFSALPSISGVWSSFALSYLAEPQTFINNLYDKLEHGGWIALLDISCFISGNMNKHSDFYERVKKFELTSYQSGVYDFNFGAKLEGLLINSGFTVIQTNTNVSDGELNFSGATAQPVIEVWQARLRRMKKLKAVLGSDYSRFEQEFIAHLQSQAHEQRSNLAYCVAIKQ